MARTANPGDTVLYVVSSGVRVPATVLATVGAAGTADLSVQSPGSPFNATVLASAQNTNGSTVGTWDFASQSGVKLTYAASAVAGDSATVSAPSGRFVKDASGASFVLTNTFVSATSICRVIKETAEANNVYVLSAVPTSNTLTVTLSGAPAANTTFSFYVVNGN